MTSRVLIGAILIAALGVSCSNDNTKTQTPVYDESNLVGRWEFFKAWRNGKQIETLVGTFYEFSQDGMMKTNLTPSAMEASFPFKLSGNQLKQESENAIVYKIDSLSNDFLAMNMVIEEVPFRIELKKAPDLETLETGDSTIIDTTKQL